MNLPRIKKVVMAALLLPTIAMTIEAALLIAYSYRDLSRLETTRRHADLLTMAGEIASSVTPDEADATIDYIKRADTTTAEALRLAQQKLDEKTERLNTMVQESLPEASLAVELASVQSQMVNVRQFRSRVALGGVSPSESVHIYRPLSEAYLDLVNALDDQIDDSRLLRKLDQLQTMLHGHEAGLVISALGTQYLDGAELTPAENGILSQAIQDYESRLKELENYASVEEPSVLTFHNGESGLQFRNLLTHIKARGAASVALPARSTDVYDVWSQLHVVRMQAWKADLDQHIRDTRELADMLTRQSRNHFIGLVTGVILLLVLATTILILATKGIRMVDRLTRDREALIQELRSASHTDILTGMPNRRGFDAAFRAMQNSRDGMETVHSLVIFDLDRFKLVNDVHGHDGGDAVLAEVARVARGSFRSGDLLARHGGEEFIVLLPDTALEDAAMAAEHVRLAIAATDIRLPDGKVIRVTASFGCACHSGRLEGSHLSQLIKKADLALYAAKFSGRNKVVRDGDFNEISMERREVRFA